MTATAEAIDDTDDDEPKTCPRCEGRGSLSPPLHIRCDVCRGTGVLPNGSLYREPGTKGGW